MDIMDAAIPGIYFIYQLFVYRKKNETKNNCLFSVSTKLFIL